MPTVHCRVVNEVEWRNNGQMACCYETGLGADIWRISVSAHVDLIARHSNLLSSDEHKKAARYFQPRDRLTYTISRIALRLLLSGYAKYPAAGLEFSEGQNKKPFLRNSNACNLYYNISHSGGLVLIAVSGSDVGVDVEKMSPDFSFNEVLEKNFSMQEIDFIEKSASPYKNFYLLWTRKEALLKATSKGIGDALKSVPCLDGFHQPEGKIIGSDKNWEVNSFTIDGSYFGCVVCQPECGHLNFFNF
ncbi:MAG: 4'-phosphopantetheinyl transferase superfamily protein [Bacteroidetes bacterium]|nr:4'-phosphopantetheinyl transferase superfamily protein [Bacteroidota bacterium]MBS1973318.1 4'-phosphopantetheinyl transferase superfamily protein [Bacteroidota bacterium]